MSVHTATRSATAGPRQLLIGGQWRPAALGGTFAVEDPATGQLVAEVADAGPDDARAALDCAAAASDGWRSRSPRQRGELLHGAYVELIERIEEFATLITLEMGKPLVESRGEVRYAAEFLRWFAEEAVRIDGRFTPAPDGGSRLIVTRQPVGPCFLITPWNFPLAMVTRKLAPALAAGCTTILKPSEHTPLSALAFAELLTDLGLPPGVVNVVPTANPAEVGAPLFADRRLRKLSFTGSTTTGKTLLRHAADGVLRVSMELGGNAAFVVLDDADVAAAVDAAVVAKLRNGGEACTAANRLYVHESVVDDFTDALAARFAALCTGPGLDPGSDVGPMISHDHRAKIAGLVDAAVGDGAQVVLGGRAIEGAGHFYEPTILAAVPASARVLHEEIFGPVAPICTFSSLDEAIALANDTPYGLVGYAFTRSLDAAFELLDRLEVGMLALNQGMVSNAAAPFGGIKASGLGREGGREGIDEYLDVKYAAVRV